jgi:hypothetical protein
MRKWDALSQGSKEKVARTTEIEEGINDEMKAVGLEIVGATER